MQWEYEVLEVKRSQMSTLKSWLNHLGAQGWEVVAIESTIDQSFAGTETKQFHVVLKRQVMTQGQQRVS